MRQATLDCPECGKAPAITETDFNLQRRRRATELALTARRSTTSAPQVSALDIFRGGELAELPERVFAAASKVASEDEDGAVELQAVAGEVAGLASWADSVPSHRPFTMVTRSAVQAVCELVRVFDVTVEALIADEAREAQRLNDDLQRALDAAGEAAAEAGEVAGMMSTVLDSDDPLGTWLGLALDGDLSTAGARGKQLLQERTGRASGPGTGMAALLYDVMVSTIADPDVFWSRVAAHLETLDAHEDSLKLLLGTSSIATRASEVVEDLWTAAREWAVTPDLETVRAQAASMLEAGHLVSEQALKFHLGVVAACTTKRGFEQTQACDVSELVQIARDQGWGVAGGLGDPDIRNAFAHRDFSVDHDGVSLSPRRRASRGEPPRVVPFDVLQDSVLELVETVGAMDLALVIAAEQIGVDDFVSPPAALLARSSLVALGWTDVDVSVGSDGTVSVEAFVPGETRLSGVAYAVQPFVGSAEVVRLHLTRADDDSDTVVSVPVAVYEDWTRAADGLAKEVAFVRLAHETVRDGEPVMSDAHVEKCAAFRACQLAVDREQPLDEVRNGLKLWRACAKEMGLDETQRLIGRALRWRTQAETGLNVEPAEMSELLALAGTEIEPVSDHLL